MTQEKTKAIISLVLGIIALIPGGSYVLCRDIGNFLRYSFNLTIKGCFLLEPILTFIIFDFWFISFPLAIISGMISLKLGLTIFQKEKIAAIGVILSVLGLTSILYTIGWAFYFAGQVT